jgi:hypothetical protein
MRHSHVRGMALLAGGSAQHARGVAMEMPCACIGTVCEGDAAVLSSFAWETEPASVVYRSLSSAVPALLLP